MNNAASLPGSQFLAQQITWRTIGSARSGSAGSARVARAVANICFPLIKLLPRDTLQQSRYLSNLCVERRYNRCMKHPRGHTHHFALSYPVTLRERVYSIVIGPAIVIAL